MNSQPTRFARCSVLLMNVPVKTEILYIVRFAAIVCININVASFVFCVKQTELQLLQTALIETKCQILQALAGAMDRPASKQLEVIQALMQT